MSNDMKWQMTRNVKWHEMSNDMNCQMTWHVKWHEISNDMKCQMTWNVKWQDTWNMIRTWYMIHDTFIPLVSRARLPVNQSLSLVELLVSLPSSLLPIGTALRYHQQSIPIIILTTRFSTIFLARIGRIGDGRQHPEEEEVRLRQHGQPCQGRAQEEGGEGGRVMQFSTKVIFEEAARRPCVLGWMLRLVWFNMACCQNILVQ